jgi:phospholipase C
MEASGASFGIEFRNTGRATAVFHVRSGSDAHIPRTYTVEPNKSLSDTWNLGAIGVSNCDLSVYGPNGCLRAFKGSVAGLRTSQLDVRTDYDQINGNVTLVITNLSTQSATVNVLDKYSGKSDALVINPGATVLAPRSLIRESGWYDLVITVAADLSIEYHFAGHVENGKDSISDPALGAF